MSANGYDYIIVGGGSAGCVLANRLSEDPAVRVLLLEAGVPDRNPFIHMPVGFSKLVNDKHTWGYKTAPQAHLNNRELNYTQAKVIGGGSSINAQVFTRGHAVDYDRWAFEEGCEGWSAAEVAKYFYRSEGNANLSGEHHGTEGPLGVTTVTAPHPTTRAFVQSCLEFGLPLNSDFNGSEQAGAGVYQTTTRNARRCSTAVGYLHPVKHRPNLTVETECTVRRLQFRKSRAVAVEYCRGTTRIVAEAANEIILSSGAIGSPKLLMLSGVGPAWHLKEHGIAVHHDLPGVGENLHDHYGVDVVAELKGPLSFDKYKKPHWAGWAGLQYILFRTGPVASNIAEGGAFWYGDQAETVPDLQFHFLAGAGNDEGKPKVPSGDGVTLNSYTLRPKSRGTVRLRSDDPKDAPIVDPNFLAEEYDRKITTEGVRISIEIFSQSSMRKFVKRTCWPEENARSPKDYEEFARRKGRTAYHPTCTCKMGVDDMAVVDPQLRVRGIDGLRVCDASIMPSLVGSNTNAPTVMIAEKASDMIRGNR